MVILTLMTQRGVWELAKQNGTYTCLAKQFATGYDLDKAIQRAVAFVAQMPKEDRYRPTEHLSFGYKQKARFHL